MSDYLDSLLSKSTDPGEIVQPRPVSLFEPTANPPRMLPPRPLAVEVDDGQPPEEDTAGGELPPAGGGRHAAVHPPRPALQAPDSGAGQEAAPATPGASVSSILPAHEQFAALPYRSGPAAVGLEVARTAEPPEPEQATRRGGPAPPEGYRLPRVVAALAPAEEAAPGRLTPRAVQPLLRADPLPGVAQGVGKRSLPATRAASAWPAAPPQDLHESAPPPAAPPGTQSYRAARSKPFQAATRAEPPQPAVQPEGQAAAPTTIQVTIGRIEVRATPAAAISSKKQAPATPILSLDEYLRQRNGGGR